MVNEDKQKEFEEKREETENQPEEAVEKEQLEEKAEPAPEKETNKTEEKKEEEKGPEQVDLSALLPDNMQEIIQIQILQLREWAHVYMGLMPHPKHKKVTKDIPQAKLAIDSAAALHNLLKPHLNEQAHREFDTLINDLKMNFISKSTQQ